jgi:hypothetical protein
MSMSMRVRLPMPPKLLIMAAISARQLCKPQKLLFHSADIDLWAFPSSLHLFPGSSKELTT